MAQLYSRLRLLLALPEAATCLAPRARRRVDAATRRLLPAFGESICCHHALEYLLKSERHVTDYLLESECQTHGKVVPSLELPLPCPLRRCSLRPTLLCCDVPPRCCKLCPPLLQARREERLDCARQPEAHAGQRRRHDGSSTGWAGGLALRQPATEAVLAGVVAAAADHNRVYEQLQADGAVVVLLTGGGRCGMPCSCRTLPAPVARHAR